MTKMVLNRNRGYGNPNRNGYGRNGNNENGEPEEQDTTERTGEEEGNDDTSRSDSSQNDYSQNDTESSESAERAEGGSRYEGSGRDNGGREGGRYDGGNGSEGGYRNYRDRRDGYYRDRNDGGYRDRNSGYRGNNGYRDRNDGGYRNNDGGGYRNNDGGGYRNNDGGGYRNNDGGGYRNNDGGGYRNNDGGGYRNNDGGYRGRNDGGGYRGQGGYRDNRPRKFKKNNQLTPRKPRSDASIPETGDPGDPNSFYPLSGVLEMHPNGYGFLRDAKESFVRQLCDPFVPGSMIEKLGLREGVLVNGLVQPGRGEQGPRIREIYDIDGMNPDDYIKVKPFDELTPINPESWLKLETAAEPLSTRVMDILTPLGKGQRALIVAPPRSGKTILLQQISQAITTNYPDIHVIVLLIDERPEEVTDFKRAVSAEVISSSLDCELESHVRLAQFVIQRCKRLSEMGKDVFLLLDSITRLARAFNKWVGNTGRTMSGGVDIKAMDIPKKIFSSARQNEEGGSLTIVGTALIDTGSRMDELIFQEFKGTGNMELVLDRRLADRRIWPAIDISQSGTRREEKLLPAEILRATTMLRRALSPMNPMEAMEQLSSNLGKCNTNLEFFMKFMRN